MQNDLCCLHNGKWVKLLTDNDIKLTRQFHYGKKNGAKALMLLHGFTSTPAVFRLIIPHLNKYDGLFCPPLAGHVNSLINLSTTTAADWLVDAEKNINQISQNFDEIDVLGLSLGGVLACHLTSIFPIRRLFLLAPALDLMIKAKLILLLAKAVKNLGFNYIRSFGGNLINKKICEITYRLIPITSVIEILTLISQFPFKSPSCKVDLFLAEQDKVVDSTKVASRFEDCQNVTIHWLKHSAHVIPLDNDYKQIIAALNQT